MLGHRAADIEALRREKGVGHAAADDQRVGPLDQVGQKIELGRHLGSANDGHYGVLGVAQRFFQRGQFLGHQPAGTGWQQQGHALGRGMRAVRGRKGVVAIDVAQRGQKRRHARIVVLLHGREPGVLDKDDGILRLGVDEVAVGLLDEGDARAERILERGHQLPERQFRDRFALGPAKMRQQHR